MKRMDTCLGPLLWYPVNDGDDPVALIVCGACGEIFVSDARPDARHFELPVLAG